MGHTIELHLAEEDRTGLRETLKPVRGPWQKEDWNPHISLTLIRSGAREETMRSILRNLRAGMEPMTIRLSSVGLFPGRRPVLYLSPAAHSGLLEAQRWTADRLEKAGIQPIHYYRAGAWTPHLTLDKGMAAADFGERLKAITRLDFAGEYELRFLDLIRFHPAVRLERCDLGEDVVAED